MSWIGKVARGLKAVVKQPIKGLHAIGEAAEDHTDRRVRELTQVVVSEAVPLVVTGVAELLERLDAENRLSGLSEDALDAIADKYEAVVSLRRKEVIGK